MVESVNKILDAIYNNPIKTIKYALFASGVFVSASNFFDCIMQKSHAYEFILYVGLVLLLSISIIIIPQNYVLCIVFAIAGAIIIFSSEQKESLSGGVMFMIGAKRIADNLFFSVFIILITALVVVANQTFNSGTASDSINIVVGYYTVYIFDYLLLLYMLKKVNGKT